MLNIILSEYSVLNRGDHELLRTYVIEALRLFGFGEICSKIKYESCWLGMQNVSANLSFESLLTGPREGIKLVLGTWLGIHLN